MTRPRNIALATCALVFIGGGWLLLRPKKDTPETSCPWNPAHEKVFLAEQLRHYPTHAPILLRLAQLERQEGDLRAAREHLEQAAAAEGKQVDVRLELSLVCWELGGFAAAEAQNRAVLQMDPGQPDALYNLGAISANHGDTRQARDFWTIAQRRDPNSDAAEKSRQAIRRLEAVR